METSNMKLSVCAASTGRKSAEEIVDKERMKQRKWTEKRENKKQYRH